MGDIEARGRKRAKRRNVKKLVLGTVGIAGLLGIALVAPNVLTGMKKLGLIPTGREKEVINRARDRLLKQGLLKREDGFLRLTIRGEIELRTTELKEATATPKRWDGRWRILIFDIPEHRRGTRDQIRRALVSIGFVQLQQSVWAYPYDCEDFIALLKADLHVGKDMLYMIVDELEGGHRLKQQFGLDDR